MSEQLWLFPQRKPLAERLGAEFFKKVPRCPGVYIMTDRTGRVLYVGQSQNLRQRLNTYKNIRPDREPRRLVKLASQADMITWEQCGSPKAARLRENELLRLHRPKFNKVNTRPEGYGYIGLRCSANVLELWLTHETTPEPELYGAFKGMRVSGYAALLRLLFKVACARQDFPLRLSSARPPARYAFSGARAFPGVEVERWAACLQQYLEGRSDELIDLFSQQLPVQPDTCGFWQTLQAVDLELVQQFYTVGPRRNRALKERHGIEARLIAPAELDDLLVSS